MQLGRRRRRRTRSIPLAEAHRVGRGRFKSPTCAAHAAATLESPTRKPCAVFWFSALRAQRDNAISSSLGPTARSTRARARPSLFRCVRARVGCVLARLCRRAVYAVSLSHVVVAADTQLAVYDLVHRNNAFPYYRHTSSRRTRTLKLKDICILCAYEEALWRWRHSNSN